MEIIEHYEAYDEAGRITTGFGALELVRTREILRRHLPPAPAAVLDVGGATGVHAAWLAGDGYRVHIVDLTPRHVEHARAELAAVGVTAEVGDARHLAQPDHSFDAVLLLGPLYHLTERADRVAALHEARRVVLPGGMVAVAAISRFASLFDGLSKGVLFEPEFRAIVEQDLRDGRHRNDGKHPDWFTTSYFHHPDELRDEIAAAGLNLVSLVGVEGIAHWMRHLDAPWETEPGRETIIFAARMIEAEPALLGLSPHLLAIAFAADS